MKLKNFAPRPMRVVEYFGETISIPSLHEWVATDNSGQVTSWQNKPDEQHGFWVYADDTIKTLRHYPIGED